VRVKNVKLSLALAMLLSLLWVETSQAFSFCFSFGSGNNRRADYYHRPYYMPVLPPGGYPVYRYGPAMHGWYGTPLMPQPWVPPAYGTGQSPAKQD
jgi:hypothetical protein